MQNREYFNYTAQRYAKHIWIMFCCFIFFVFSAKADWVSAAPSKKGVSIAQSASKSKASPRKNSKTAHTRNNKKAKSSPTKASEKELTSKETKSNKEAAAAQSIGPNKEAAAPKPPASKSPNAKKEHRKNLLDMIHKTAKKHGLDPLLVQAVVEQESGYHANAVSPKGAQGLMQIMPETGQDLGLKAPFEPQANIDAGCRYLKSMLGRFGGEVRLALAAYNAGPGAVSRYGTIPPYAETQDYVASTARRYLRMKAIGTDNPALLALMEKFDRSTLGINMKPAPSKKNLFKSLPSSARLAPLTSPLSTQDLITLGYNPDPKVRKNLPANVRSRLTRLEPLRLDSSALTNNLR